MSQKLQKKSKIEARGGKRTHTGVLQLTTEQFTGSEFSATESTHFNFSPVAKKNPPYLSCSAIFFTFRVYPTHDPNVQWVFRFKNAKYKQNAPPLQYFFPTHDPNLQWICRGVIMGAWVAANPICHQGSCELLVCPDNSLHLVHPDNSLPLLVHPDKRTQAQREGFQFQLNPPAVKWQRALLLISS